MENNPLRFKVIMSAAVSHSLRKFWLICAAVLIFYVPLIMAYVLFWDNQRAIEYFMFRRSYREYQAVSNILTAVIIGSFFIYKILLFLLLNEEKPRFFSLLWKAVCKLPGYVFFKLVLLAKTFIWLLVFIIPGIVQFIHWSAGELIYLLEGKSIKVSFEQSKNIIKPYRNKYLDYLFYVFIFSSAFWYPYGIVMTVLTDYLRLKGFVLAGETIHHLIPLEIMIFGSLVLVFYFEIYKELSARTHSSVV